MLVDALALRYPLDIDESGQWVSHESLWPVMWFTLAWGGVGLNMLFGLWRLLA
jgi:hypothetical protein